MKISLVISTYNRVGALRLCLMSVAHQTRLPDEVIVADDGSTQETHELVEQMAAGFPCPLHHAWHEDEGFRLAAIRNKAVRDFCTGDYLIFVDGDIIMERHFIADHEKMARSGYFIIGSRAKLNKPMTRYLIMKQSIKVGLFKKGVRRRENTLRMPFLFFLTKHLYSWKRLYGRGANMAMWYDDFKQVNGFDENMIGYGCEDFDIFNRLFNIGVKRNYAKFRAIEYHLEHQKGSRSQQNAQIFYGDLSRRICLNGLVKINEHQNYG
jgi:glycosyltransferase involved in cell wall biosynthesis